ncbi:MAG: BlaI/MecI/CopY family transcriptional regulator [Gammaproteobacteria bacterium]|nr:BlaI/MecI/CopY family transcriptional regulator [Gammaproteobacteria bacterium]
MIPAPTELVILKHLWLSGTQSIREIHDGVADTLSWSYSSTRKTVERMIRKKMIGVADFHGLKVYRAKLKKIPTLAGLVRTFAAEVLGLEGGLPVSNLVRSQLLSEAELAELDALLKQQGVDDKDVNQ